jgi:uncharacterized membrane protein YoaK (UPF0700 family)
MKRAYLATGLAHTAMTMLAPFALGIHYGAWAERHAGHDTLGVVSFALSLAWVAAGVAHWRIAKRLRIGKRAP